VKKILLDTSVIIDFLRQKNKKDTLLIALLEKEYQFYVSILTHTELYAGKKVWKENDAQIDLEKLFFGMQILPLEKEVSKKAGEIRAKNDTTLMDAIIAATAIIHDLNLVTLNTKDFEKIKELNLYNLL
jgi:predicted nucleic acid-binding protein